MEPNEGSGGWGATGDSHPGGWNLTWCNHFERNPTNKQIRWRKEACFMIWQFILSLGMCTYVGQKTRTKVFIAALFVIAQTHPRVYVQSKGYLIQFAHAMECFTERLVTNYN